MKRALGTTPRQIQLTRIESWATPGVPDILACDERGNFSFLELKILTKRGKMRLSPHQVAWITRHQHASVFIVGVRHADGLDVYSASQAVDIASGREVSPIAAFAAGNWAAFFDFVFPTEE